MALDINDYLQKIGKKYTKESTLAAALVWRLAEGRSGVDVDLNQVVSVLVDSGFKSSVNKSRLKKTLANELGINKGSKKDTFRCSLKHIDDLDARFSVDEEHSIPKISFSFLDEGTFPESRAYLVRMGEQINGTYEYEFYDGCAVLMRRLMESLLIEVFEHTGQGQLIKDAAGEYKMLKGIISAIGGSSIKFARGIDKTIANVKKVGDNAAHGRTHITKKNDINDLKIEYRKLISELKSKSNIS
ncbi:hypothetical protein ABFZ85_12150 [Hyphococcus formosus]|uniref:hypothetical protein n=1 Tax=Hyphococcus formosus TaxID=3143534 RepID=UPI00398BB1F4